MSDENRCELCGDTESDIDCCGECAAGSAQTVADGTATRTIRTTVITTATNA